MHGHWSCFRTVCHSHHHVLWCCPQGSSPPQGIPLAGPPPGHLHSGTPLRTPPWRDPSPYMGPLMIRAIRKFMSAMNSCRSGYGRSSSVLLGGQRWVHAPGSPTRVPLQAHPTSECLPRAGHSLVGEVLLGVDVHHPIHHLQPEAQVSRHGLGVPHLIGVLLGKRGVHRDICSQETPNQTRVMGWIHQSPSSIPIPA